MLSRVKYDVIFSSTGKCLSQDLTFETGLTCITGPNESGKSLILEIITYALFGPIALRAPMATYQKLDAELEFVVKDVPYRIERGLTYAKIYVNGELKATGAKAVNAVVQRVFGYGLEIFDVAHACNQNQIEALAQMPGQARKAVIDRVIGVEQIDKGSDYVKDQITEANAVVKGLELALGPEPVTVVPPAGYQSSDSCQAKLDNLKPSISKLLTARAWLQAQGVTEEPVKPVEPEEITAWRNGFFPVLRQAQSVETIATAIHDQQPKLDRLIQLRAQLQANEPGPEPASPEIGISLQNLKLREERWEKKLALQSRVAGIQPPSYTETCLDQLEAQWASYEVWQAMVRKWDEKPLLAQDCIKEQLLAHEICDKRAHLQKEIEDRTAGMVQCPHCGEKFDLGGEAYDILCDQLDQLPLVSRPELTERELKALLASAQAWASCSVSPTEEPSLSMAEIKSQRHGLKLKGVFDELATYDDVTQSHATEIRQIEDHDRWLVKKHFCIGCEMEIEELEDVEEQVEILKQKLALAQDYEQKVDFYTKAKPYWDEVVRLAPLEGEAQELEQLLAIAREYETKRSIYENAKARYEQTKAQLEQAKEKARDWKLAAQALKELRTKIKSFLVPSLNGVASQLLAQMTGGARSQIVISDDFENILVDGQLLETLSGSGKAVANLAIRLGLGQVLTNRVFSVFMGDELDASMDANRSQYVASCLKNLSGTIRQLIIVSHKDLEDVDHRVSTVL